MDSGTYVEVLKIWWHGGVPNKSKAFWVFFVGTFYTYSTMTLFCAGHPVSLPCFQRSNDVSGPHSNFKIFAYIFILIMFILCVRAYVCVWRVLPLHACESRRTISLFTPWGPSGIKLRMSGSCKCFYPLIHLHHQFAYISKGPQAA